MRTLPYPELSSHRFLSSRSGGSSPTPSLRCLKTQAALALEREFATLNARYLDSGGIVQGDQIAAMMYGHFDQPISRLARLVINRQVVHFQWGSQLLMPVFQFDRHTMEVRAEVLQTVAELSAAFSDLDLVQWFVEPSAWLGGKMPIDALKTNAPAVLDAARADRFIAAG
jgi:hypothetical protein